MEMSYNNRFVMTIIQNGKILKELANGAVPIPFNSEYTIRLRNKHNRRAVCRLSIDGENVSSGGFIIKANSHIDIERPADVAKKFKFVSLDSEEAQDHGKDGPNYNKIKGVIRAEFALEKELEYPLNWHNQISYRDENPYKPGYKSLNQQQIGSSILRGNLFDCLQSQQSISSFNKNQQVTNSSLNLLQDGATVEGSLNLLQDGATVEGSKSNQQFKSVYFNHEDNWTTIKLFLQGYNSENIKKVVQEEIINNTDDELLGFRNDLLELQNELLELKKLKLKQEIEKLKAELSI